MSSLHLVRSLSILTALAMASALPAAAQDENATRGAASRAADAITASLIQRHVDVIAHDSMMGRDTPSRGLELTARYVEDQFRRLGLEPGGDSGGYQQRYAITQRKLDGEGSWVRLAAGGITAMAALDRDARYIYGARSGKPVTGPAVLVGGALEDESLAAAPLHGQIVVFVVDFGRGAQRTNAALSTMLGHRPRAIVLVSNRDSTRFDQLVRQQFRVSEGVSFESEPDPPVIEVHERAIAALLQSSGVDLAAVRDAAMPVVRPLPDVQVSATLADVTLRAVTAPNTVAILRGTDPALRDEYIVFSAHMDHVGVNGASGKDSIWNGADDDASGTAGVLALAEAFAKAPTRRSLIFLTVSGEEKGLWGSEWFAGNPPVPIGQIVANLNLDMIGRNWKDTIVVIGKEHSDLGETLNRVTAAHPELRMSAIDDLWPQENFYGRSDHYNFAKRGVPVLFFFNGTHADYHQPSDSPEKIDAEKESRIVKLIYYVGQDVGNAAKRPVMRK